MARDNTIANGIAHELPTSQTELFKGRQLPFCFPIFFSLDASCHRIVGIWFISSAVPFVFNISVAYLVAFHFSFCTPEGRAFNFTIHVSA